MSYAQETATKRVLMSLVLGMLVYLPPGWSADYEMVSRIESFESNRIVLPDETSFDLVNERSPLATRARMGFTTRCMEVRGRVIDCNMLAGVGYVDRARIVLSSGVVKELQVLELMQ